MFVCVKVCVCFKGHRPFVLNISRGILFIVFDRNLLTGYIRMLCFTTRLRTNLFELQKTKKSIKVKNKIVKKKLDDEKNDEFIKIH